jgi:hypothetical protein
MIARLGREVKQGCPLWAEPSGSEDAYRLDWDWTSWMRTSSKPSWSLRMARVMVE